MIEYHLVEAEVFNTKHRGLAVVEDGLLTIACPRFGEKSAVLHSLTPERLGRMLLTELIREG